MFDVVVNEQHYDKMNTNVVKKKKKKKVHLIYFYFHILFFTILRSEFQYVQITRRKYQTRHKF